MTELPGLTVQPIKGLPMFSPGMAVAPALLEAVGMAGFRDGDIVVLAQKIVSKSEGRLVRLADVAAGETAKAMAAETGREPAMVQLILDESEAVLRATPAAIIARHKAGHVLANAGIDASNVDGGEDGTVLLWPVDPDASARAIRAELQKLTGKRLGVVIADSMGRAWRMGTVGTAIGCAGVTVLDDRRGLDQDLYGRTLQATVIAIADAIAGLGVLVMGEGAQGTPAALVRGGAGWVCSEDGPGAVANLRPLEQDMFR